MSRSSNNYLKINGVKGPVESIGIPDFTNCFEITSFFFSMRSSQEVTSSGIMQGCGGISLTHAYFITPVKYNEFLYFAHSKRVFEEITYVIKKDTDKKAIVIMEILFRKALFQTCFDHSIKNNVENWLQNIACVQWGSCENSEKQNEYKNDFLNMVSMIDKGKKNLELGQGQMVSITFESFRLTIRPVRGDGSVSGKVVFDFKGYDSI